MGGFGNVARSIGGVGNDVATASQTLAQLRQQQTAQQLDLLTKRLQLQKLQQSLGQPQTQSEQTIAAYERILKRPLTDAEKQIVLGLAPEPKGPAAPEKPFNVAPGDAVYDPVSGTVKYTNPAKAAPDRAPVRMRVADGTEYEFDPDHQASGTRLTSDDRWVKVGAAKPTSAGRGGSGDYTAYDASIRAVAASNGKLRPSNAKGWWQRAEALGLDKQILAQLPAAPNSPLDKAKKSLAQAQMKLDSVQDNFNKWPQQHYFDAAAGVVNPYAQDLADKQKMLDEAADTIQDALSSTPSTLSSSPATDLSDIGGKKVK